MKIKCVVSRKDYNNLDDEGDPKEALSYSGWIIAFISKDNMGCAIVMDKEGHLDTEYLEEVKVCE